MPVGTIRIPDADFISEHEFATMVGKSVRTTRRWRFRGLGPRATILGREIFHSRPAVIDFMRRQEQNISTLNDPS